MSLENGLTLLSVYFVRGFGVVCHGSAGRSYSSQKLMSEECTVNQFGSQSPSPRSLEVEQVKGRSVGFPPSLPGFGLPIGSVPKNWRRGRGRRWLCRKLRLGRVSSHRSDVPQDQGPPPARISEPISYIELSRRERKAFSRTCP